MNRSKFTSIIIVVLLAILAIVWFKYCDSKETEEIIKEENIELLKKVEILRDEIYFKRNNIDSLRNIVAIKNSDLSKSYEKLDSILSTLDKSLSNTQKDIREKGGSLEDIKINRDNIDNISEILSKVRAEDIKLNQRTLREFQHQKNVLVIRYEEKIKNLNIKIKNLEKLNRKKDEKIKTLEENNENLTTALNAAINNNKITKEEMDSLIGQQNEGLAVLEDSINQLNSNIELATNEKEQMNGQINNLTTAIKKISKNSFKAFYKFKEGRKKEKLVQLDEVRRHKSRHIKKIFVRFALNSDLIESPNTSVKVEIQNSFGILLSPSYSKNVFVKDYIGKTEFEIPKKLKKGSYRIKIFNKNEEIQVYKFKVS